VLRIADDPRIVGDAVGTTPIFNWLLWGYAFRPLRSGPAASSCAAAATMRRCARWSRPRSCSRVLLAFMEIRHAVNDGDPYFSSAGLTEVALQVCVALAMAIGLERLRLRTGSVVHNAGAILLTAFAGLATVGGLLVLEQPLLLTIDVGGRFNQPAAARLCPARVLA